MTTGEPARAYHVGGEDRRDFPGLAHPCGTPALHMPSRIRSLPARKIGLSFSWPARQRWIVNVGSSASPTWVSACASPGLPRFPEGGGEKEVDKRPISIEFDTAPEPRGGLLSQKSAKGMIPAGPTKTRRWPLHFFAAGGNPATAVAQSWRPPMLRCDPLSRHHGPRVTSRTKLHRGFAEAPADASCRYAAERPSAGNTGGFHDR